MYTNNLFTINNIPTLNMPGGNCERTSASTMCGCEMRASDKILISVNKYGREIASMQVTGFVSINGILSSLIQMLTDEAGLLTIKLRNPRCGWMVKRSILTGHRHGRATIASA